LLINAVFYLLEYPHKFLRGLPEVVSVVEDSRAVLEVQVEDPEVSFISINDKMLSGD
jgi:hypothetical protein